VDSSAGAFLSDESICKAVQVGMRGWHAMIAQLSVTCVAQPEAGRSAVLNVWLYSHVLSGWPLGCAGGFHAGGPRQEAQGVRRCAAASWPERHAEGSTVLPGAAV
jgi:hypothetical protein